MKVFSATDIGQKRTMNQDFVFASASPVGNLPNLFVVADGMGGHNAGDFASRYGLFGMELKQQTARFLSRQNEIYPWKAWVRRW